MRKKFRLNRSFFFSATLFVVLLVFPLPFQQSNNTYLVHIVSLMFIYAILSLGLQIVIGVTGLLDLGFIAFYGIGCYASILLSIKGIPFLPNLLLTILIVVLFRLAISIPSLRLRGDYYAIVTLGFGEITRLVLNNWDAFTNGPKGLPRIHEQILSPSILKFTFHTEIHYYYLNAFFFFLILFGSIKLLRSSLGRAFFAIREDELAAEHLGIPLFLTKLLSVSISAVFAATAGVLYVHWNKFISPESFTFMESVLLVCMVVLGGMGSIPGVLLATVLLIGIPELLRMPSLSSFLHKDLTQYRYFFFGASLVLMTIFRPRGIFPEKRPTLPT